jgi:hypothetical protein
MSVAELQQGTEAAWKHAYSFRSIARRISHSPAPWPVKLGTNLGYRFYAHNLSRFYNCDWIIGRTTNAAGDEVTKLSNLQPSTFNLQPQ